MEKQKNRKRMKSNTLKFSDLIGFDDSIFSRRLILIVAWWVLHEYNELHNSLLFKDSSGRKNKYDHQNEDKNQEDASTDMIQTWTRR